MKLSRILTAALAAMLIIGVSGCMDKKVSKKYSPEEKKEMVLAYLQEKYDEEFVGKHYSLEQWGQPWDEYFVYPKNSTDKDGFYVRGNMQSDGTYIMSDGYFGVIIKYKYEAFMTDLVKEVYPQFKLYTRIGVEPHPDRLNKDTKISEIYNKEERFDSSNTIFVMKSSVEDTNINEDLNKIAKKMVENKLVGDIALYVVYDEKYEAMSWDALSNITPAEYKLYFEKNPDGGNTYYSIRVRNNLEIKNYD